MSLIHFEFIFGYGVKQWASFIVLHVAVHLLKKNCPFPNAYSCLLCKIYFLALYFLPLICYVYFVLTYCFDCCNIVI